MAYAYAAKTVPWRSFSEAGTLHNPPHRVVRAPQTTAVGLRRIVIAVDHLNAIALAFAGDPLQEPGIHDHGPLIEDQRVTAQTLCFGTADIDELELAECAG